MPSQSTLGLYREGDSWLHLLPAGAKLAVLAILGMVSVWLQKIWPLPVTMTLVVALLYLTAGFSLVLAWRQLRPLRWILLFMIIANGLTLGWLRSVAVLATLVLLVLAAALVTLTTKTSELVQVLVKILGPTKRLGVDVDRVGLVILLGIRCVPVMANIIGQVREAQYARGAGQSLRAFGVPLVVRSLRQAEAIGDALVARGFDD